MFLKFSAENTRKVEICKKTRSIVYGMYVHTDVGCQVDFVDPDRIDGFLFFNT